MRALIHSDASGDPQEFDDISIELLADNVDVSVVDTTVVSEDESQARVRADVRFEDGDESLTFRVEHPIFSTLSDEPTGFSIGM
ncbi:MAG: hypothetical protein V5A55_05600 [Halovenus sp.]